MEHLDSSEELLEKINTGLPDKCDRRLKDADNQIPLRIASIKGALIHRVANLGRCAIDNFRQGHFISGAVLTRAVLETAVQLFLLAKRIRSALDRGETASLEDFLSRLILGSRNHHTEVTAYNILTALDQISKEYEPCREMYDQLSEFSHPNFAGVLASYSYLSDDKRTLHLGPDPSPTLSLGTIPLRIALLLSDHYYIAISNDEPGLRLLCNPES